MEVIKIYRLEGLAARRKAAGYTQQELADLLGVPRANLAMWETLTSSPRAGILPVIADLLLCTVDELYKAPEEAETPHQSPPATAFPQGEAHDESITQAEEGDHAGGLG